MREVSPGHCPFTPSPPLPALPAWTLVALRHSVDLQGAVEPVSKCMGWWQGPRLGLRKLRSLLLWSDLGQEKQAIIFCHLTPAGATMQMPDPHRRVTQFTSLTSWQRPFSAAQPSGLGCYLMYLQSGADRCFKPLLLLSPTVAHLSVSPYARHTHALTPASRVDTGL